MSKVMQWRSGTKEKEVDNIINELKNNSISKEGLKQKIMNVQNVELCSIDEHNVDEVIDMERASMSKEGTLHLVYQRQYYDDENHDYFFINYTIFRNVPLSQLNRLNNKDFQKRVKEFCDKNFVETVVTMTTIQR